MKNKSSFSGKKKNRAIFFFVVDVTAWFPQQLDSLWAWKLKGPIIMQNTPEQMAWLLSDRREFLKKKKKD